MIQNYQLLEKLTHINGPSGDEAQMTDFLIEYVKINSPKWKRSPTLIYGERFQNNIILVFGKPKVAVFAHIDSIGFTVRYQDQLVPIGSPDLKSGHPLKGMDSKGPVECILKVDENRQIFYEFGRGIESGTNLVWNSAFKQDDAFVEGPYMDNRLGVYAALMLAETLDNGIIVFSTWEEHGGGSVPYLLKYIHEKYSILRTIVCDITWITDGVVPGQGVVISMKDHNIPRRSYLEEIISLAESSGIPFQLEIESGGSSDGREIQQSAFPIDWVFIGAAEQNVHSPNERVNKSDIESMINLYRYLLKHL